MDGSTRKSKTACRDIQWVLSNARICLLIWAGATGLLIPSIGISADTTKQDAIPTAWRFGVFPYLSPTRLERIYAPSTASLQDATGVRIHFRTAASFNRFFKNLSEGHYDIALIQPFWVPPAIHQFGYIPLARMQEPFTALIVVPENSPLKTPEDLRGKILATPPAFVPVVHMARQALSELGLKPGEDITLHAYKSVDSCFQQVFIGEADACVAPPFAPAVVAEKMHVKLRVILQTPAIPNLTLVAHPRVPVAQRQKIQETVLNWSKQPAGQSLLKIMKTKGFIPAHDIDYNAVRALLQTIKEEAS